MNLPIGHDSGQCYQRKEYICLGCIKYYYRRIFQNIGLCESCHNIYYRHGHLRTRPFNVEIALSRQLNNNESAKCISGHYQCKNKIRESGTGE
jgi:ribosomal protein L37AE/L43A